jgi:putative nucleotidyltransferase with HDIG domain
MKKILSWLDHPSYGRFLLLGVFILATTSVLLRPRATDYDYEVGRTWNASPVVADFDFPLLKTQTEYQNELETAGLQVPQVFVLNQNAAESARRTLDQYFNEIRALEQRERLLRPTAAPAALAQWQTLVQALKPATTPDELQAVLRQTTIALLRERTNNVVQRLYEIGYLNTTDAGIRSAEVSLRKSVTHERVVGRSLAITRNRIGEWLANQLTDLPANVRTFTIELLLAVLEPNYEPDPKQYELELADIRKSILTYKSKISKGDTLVARNQRITPEVVRKLESLAAESKFLKRNSFLEFLSKAAGEFMMVVLLTVIIVMFLELNRKRLLANNRRLALLLTLYVLTTVLFVFTQNYGRELSDKFGVNVVFSVPLSIAAIMLTIFFDDRIGYFSNVVIALLGGLSSENSFECFFIQTCAGSIAVFNLATIRRRSQFFSTAALLFMAYTVAYVGYNVSIQGDFFKVNYTNLTLFGLNVLLTLSTYPLVYFFERLYGVTSDLTLIELLDTEHPLLKQLAQRAPGTYQHSLQVATIAEEVAKRIGANALQVHVGALYHDIGKMKTPQYFIENQSRENSPHQLISPQASAEIIIDHVRYGEELARQYRLPIEIIEFISSHHGTSRVEFFYRKHCDGFPQDQPLPEDILFRYPGPLPTTKEMAILMCADSIEAASRSLDSPDPEQLELLVNRLIDDKIQTRQLDEAAISFRDVGIMRRSILKSLTSIYHHRIKYPTQLPEPSKSALPVA